MATETGKQKANHPPKQFGVPADIAALGSYNVAIVHAMRNEHQKRMSGARRK